MKFYATKPSRGRLSEDVLAFVSLLKYGRDEQAEKLVLFQAKPAEQLHALLDKEGLIRRLEHPEAWRDAIDDPLDPYSSDAVKELIHLGGGGALYHLWWKGERTQVAARFSVPARGAGFTLQLDGFEHSGIQPPKPAKGDKPDEKADGSKGTAIFDAPKKSPAPSAGKKPPPRKK